MHPSTIRPLIPPTHSDLDNQPRQSRLVQSARHSILSASKRLEHPPFCYPNLERLKQRDQLRAKGLAACTYDQSQQVNDGSHKPTERVNAPKRNKTQTKQYARTNGETPTNDTMSLCKPDSQLETQTQSNTTRREPKSSSSQGRWLVDAHVDRRREWLRSCKGTVRSKGINKLMGNTEPTSKRTNYEKSSKREKQAQRRRWEVRNQRQ